jgi:hypothetical protein
MMMLPDRLDRCAHDGSPAVAVYSVPYGCVGLPDLVVQPLCAQHESSLPDGAYDDVYDLLYEITPGWPRDR